MKKTNNFQKASVKESTVLSDPKRKGKHEKKRVSRGKIALWVVAVVLAVFVAIPWGIVQVVKLVNNKPMPTFEERLSGTRVFAEATKVYTLKTADGMTEGACESIAEALLIDDYCGEFQFTVIQNGDGVVGHFKFTGRHDASRDEWFKMQMIRYASAMMTLVDNMHKVTWEYPDTGNSTGGSFTRNDIELLLGYPAHLYSTIWD